MKIGIVSDSHGKLVNVRLALAMLRERGVQQVIHCGDIDDAETIPLFAGWMAHFVWGNCDLDRTAMRRAIDEIGATLHEPYGHLEVDGLLIAFVHGDDRQLLDDLIASEAYDFLFHGHTHVAGETMVGRTRVVNPGALQRAHPKTVAVLDVGRGAIETIEVAP